jgi:hypothetical protein
MKDSQERQFRRDMAVAISVFFAIAFGALSVWRGQDANWDLKNYHLYNAYELLHGRLWLDLNAGGFQGLFNPLLDLPYYAMSMRLLPGSPRVVAFIMGLNSALLALAATSIVFAVFRKARPDVSWIAIAAAIYIGISGGLSISELGTTYNDIIPAALVLFGVAIVLVEFDRPIFSGRYQYLGVVVSGILLGIAAGLKLSAALFAPPFVIALALVRGLSRRMLAEIMLFSLAGIAGWVLVAGVWTYQVFALTGNPVLPMFNQIFQSDWYPPIGFFDERWRPRGFLQTIAFPFFWVRPGYLVITEVVFGDPRFAAGYIAVAILAAGAVTRYLARSRMVRLDSWKPSREAWFVLAFIVVSYVLWQVVFCIGRYAIGIEVLLGIPILLAIWKIASLIAAGAVRRVLIDVAMVLVAVVLHAGTHYPDWGRVAYDEAVFALQAPRLPPNSLVVISGSPNGYIVPFLRSDGIRFIGVNHFTKEARGYRLWNETAQRIAKHEGEIFVLERTDGSSERSTLHELKLAVDEARCTSIPTNLDRDIRLCAARRLDG